MLLRQTRLLNILKGTFDEFDNSNSANWLYMIFVKDRNKFFKVMDKFGIEVDIAHSRNDDMEIFKKYKNKCPNMDKIESHYVCLPLHNKLTKKDIRYICNVVKNDYR